MPLAAVVVVTTDISAVEIAATSMLAKRAPPAPVTVPAIEPVATAGETAGVAYGDGDVALGVPPASTPYTSVATLALLSTLPCVTNGTPSWMLSQGTLTPSVI